MSTALRPRGMIRRGLALSVWEAAVVGMMFASLEAWLVPLVQTRLGAPAAWIGLLTVIPQMLGIGLGPVTEGIIARLGGNKRAAVLCAWAQTASLALLAVPLWLPEERWAASAAMGLVVVFGGLGCIIGPSWVAWTGGMVPRPLQGGLTSRRLRWFHTCRLLSACLFAGIMHLLPLAGGAWGLQAVFAFAALSRGISAWLQQRSPDPPPRPPGPPSDSQRRQAEIAGFGQFLRTLHRTPFGRWTIAWAGLHFGVMVGAPFFVPYLVERPERGGLGLVDHPFTLTAVIYVATLSRLAVLPVAGRLVARHSPAAVLRLAVVVITFVPVAYVLTPSLWAIGALEVVSGVAWGLAECALGPLLFSCHSDPRQRARMVAWHQMVVLVCVVLGSALGTALMRFDLLPPIGGAAFRSVFLASILLRVPAAFLATRLLPPLRELNDPAGRTELWLLIPGADLALTLGRGLRGWLRRPDPD